jgi:two-component system response regulator ChvI
LWHDRPVDLTFGEFRVVALLALSGRDITYREIYDALRGENFVAGDGPQGYRANVRALIKRIREKFQGADDGFAAIEAFPGFGYRWVAERGGA